ncbi:longevity assurance proteins LAG1/LAC1, partial [Rhizodiscina lignyota]
AAAKHVSDARGNVKQMKNDSLLRVLCAYVVEHQIGISVNLLLLLILTHGLFPRARPLTRKFYELSYHDASTGKYTQGWDDLCFVVFWVVVLTGLRAALMDYILKPAARAGGIRKSRVRLRFAEQAWIGIYPTGSWSLGMYIMYHSPYWLNLREMWASWPSPQMDGLVKWYYLVQFAFWLQQIVVVNIEERRKDYAQMFTHHIFTCTLIFFSYGSYQIPAGIVILCIMDVVDILLPLAKCLKYLKFTTACDIGFGVFLITWFIARHLCYLLVCWSLYAHAPQIIYGCFSASSGALVSSDISNYPGGTEIMSNLMVGWTNPGGVICFNPQTRWTFLALLLGLQVITLIWFGMIIRVAWGVIMGRGADDSRSDDEDGDESEDEEVDGQSRPPPPTAAISLSTSLAQRPPSAGSNGSQSSRSTPYEEEVGVDELYLGMRRTPSPRMKRMRSGGKGRTSAISIPGHSDPKDILNRIGCE